MLKALTLFWFVNCVIATLACPSGTLKWVIIIIKLTKIV